MNKDGRYFGALFDRAASVDREKALEVMDDFYLNGVMTSEEYEQKLLAIIGE